MKKWENFTRQEIEEFVKESSSLSTLASKLGYSKGGGCRSSAIKEMIQILNLDVSHFTGWNGETYESDRYMSFAEYIKSNSVQSNKIRRKLLKEGLKEHICECCLNTIWMDKPIPLEVHHKDGNKDNNNLDNLQLLCPNCHALTDNYRGKNTHKHKLKFLQEHHEGKLPE
jgi:5-methylcytosine-specific restriction endonuclease McrA